MEEKYVRVEYPNWSFYQKHPRYNECYVGLHVTDDSVDFLFVPESLFLEEQVSTKSYMPDGTRVEYYSSYAEVNNDYYDYIFSMEEGDEVLFAQGDRCWTDICIGDQHPYKFKNGTIPEVNGVEIIGVKDKDMPF